MPSRANGCGTAGLSRKRRARASSSSNVSMIWDARASCSSDARDSTRRRASSSNPVMILMLPANPVPAILPMESVTCVETAVTACYCMAGTDLFQRLASFRDLSQLKILARFRRNRFDWPGRPRNWLRFVHSHRRSGLPIVAFRRMARPVPNRFVSPLSISPEKRYMLLKKNASRERATSQLASFRFLIETRATPCWPLVTEARTRRSFCAPGAS